MERVMGSIPVRNLWYFSFVKKVCSHCLRWRRSIEADGQFLWLSRKNAQFANLRLLCFNYHTGQLKDDLNLDLKLFLFLVSLSGSCAKSSLLKWQFIRHSSIAQRDSLSSQWLQMPQNNGVLGFVLSTTLYCPWHNLRDSVHLPWCVTNWVC